MSDCSSRAFEVPKKPNILPCPHCGNPKPSSDTLRTTKSDWMFTVKCEDCDSLTWKVNQDLDQAREEAIDAWNTRYEPTCHFVDGGPSFAYRCDQCGYDTNYYKYFTYCPGCGARVEVVDQ